MRGGAGQDDGVLGIALWYEELWSDCGMGEQRDFEGLASRLNELLARIQRIQEQL